MNRSASNEILMHYVNVSKIKCLWLCELCFFTELLATATQLLCDSSKNYKPQETVWEPSNEQYITLFSLKGLFH